MLDRRNFVLSAATAAGGALVLPTAALAASASYERVTIRFVAGRPVTVPNSRARVGDYAVFTAMRDGRTEGPIALFAVTPTAGGDDRDDMLEPLGQVQDLAAARRLLRQQPPTIDP